MCEQNNKKQFALVDYDYNFILYELRPLIERYFRRENTDLSIFGIKVINRAEDIASLLVLTTKKTLWSFKYNFVNPENWEVHKLQSSAKPVEIVELRNLRSNFIEIQGMSPVEADEACLKFFIDSSTCLQKEERAKLLEESKKAAELKKVMEST